MFGKARLFVVWFCEVRIVKRFARQDWFCWFFFRSGITCSAICESRRMLFFVWFGKARFVQQFLRPGVNFGYACHLLPHCVIVYRCWCFPGFSSVSGMVVACHLMNAGQMSNKAVRQVCTMEAEWLACRDSGVLV